MIKIGQIGLGHNHSDKIRSALKFPQLFEVVGYAEENEEWIRRRGARPYLQQLPRLSVEEVLEKSDAVLVETDVWDLTKTAQMCVDAGKHIHMDKPASGTLEEFKHLLDTAKAQNLVVQLGYMYRYNPGVIKLLEMIKEGKLGTITSIRGEMSLRHRDAYRQWLGNFKGGDMYIFGSHMIDLIVYLLGEPKKVLSSMVHSGMPADGGVDLSAAILEYEHAIAQVFSSSLDWDGWDQRCFSVTGELGSAHIRPMEEPCRLTFAPRRNGGSVCSHLAAPIALGELSNTERYDGMLAAFHDYVTGVRENPFSYDHEYAVQKTIWEAVGGVQMLGKKLEAQ